MRDDCGRFFISSDMNFDGVFTISDLVLIVEYVFLFPAKLVIGIVSLDPGLTRFFEINCLSGGSWGGAIFSLFVWWIVVLTAIEASTGSTTSR